MAGRRDDAFQLGPHQVGATGLEPAPTAQRRHLPRRDLRVHPVDLQDHVGHEAIAPSRRMVERPLVGGEIADQRAPAVGIPDAEVLRDGPAPRPRRSCRSAGPRPAARTICRAPGRRHGSADRSPRRRPRAPARRGWSTPTARPAGRSYCRHASILRLGHRRAAFGIAASQQPQRDRLQPADALGGADRSSPAAIGDCACASSAASSDPIARRNASRLR